MRRLPPQNTEENLAHLIDLVPHLTDDLLSSIDQPLKVRSCKQTGAEYLICDYNRDGDSYRYYDGGVSSVYLWDLDDGFAGVVLIKKLTSTVMLYLFMNNRDVGKMNLSGSLTRQAEQDLSIAEGQQAHIANLGRMIEDMELRMRNSLQEVYFGKTKDVVNELRAVTSLADQRRQEEIRRELADRLQARQR
ncbi:uncharacterized protein VTP21DRAFT_3979 [Calcarisporiella thermophila]|uniref:uncharacterized protein n=1 Tax=Calcarisporiella thermophila TaxID=911321 RepID=UPI003743C193